MKQIFKSAGFIELPVADKLSHESVFLRNIAISAISRIAPSAVHKPNYSIWGANKDMWLRGNWARGRALANNNFVTAHRHNFCRLWSGGRAFLQAGAPHQEVAVQLSHLFPCCPTTRVSLGDLTKEKFSAAMQRAENHKIFRAINRGRPFNGCHELGLTPADARKLMKEKGNICLMCDEILAHLDQENFTRSPFDIYV